MASLKYQRAVYWFGLQILKIGTMIKDESKFGQKPHEIKGTFEKSIFPKIVVWWSGNKWKSWKEIE